MSRRKPLAAVAAVTAAAAVAIPAATASAQTAPTPITPIKLSPPMWWCITMQKQSEAAGAAGLPRLASLIAKTENDLGCGGAAL